MNNTALNKGIRINLFNNLFKACQTIYAEKQYLCYSSTL